jgi:hypothetical protein
MPYCPNCGFESVSSDKYCRACGLHLETGSEEVTRDEVGRKLWKKKWFLLVIGLLVVGLIIGAVLLVDRHGLAEDADLIAARATLNSYLGYAVQQDKAAMWDMIHPDSKILYENFDDFASNNGITDCQIVYVFDDWDVESAEKIPSWRTYVDVVLCKVGLSYKLHTLADIVDIAFLGGIVPREQEVTATVFLVEVDGQWTIFSEHSPSSVSGDTSSSSNESQTDSSSTAIDESAIPTITAQELIKEFNTKGMLGMKYRDQVIKVTGVIDDILSSSVNLAGPHSLEWISCEFESSQLGQLASLSKGQTITVQGVCTGGFIFGPTLNECEVVA